MRSGFLPFTELWCLNTAHASHWHWCSQMSWSHNSTDFSVKLNVSSRWPEILQWPIHTFVSLEQGEPDRYMASPTWKNKKEPQLPKWWYHNQQIPTTTRLIQIHKMSCLAATGKSELLPGCAWHVLICHCWFHIWINHAVLFLMMKCIKLPNERLTQQGIFEPVIGWGSRRSQSI